MGNIQSAPDAYLIGAVPAAVALLLHTTAGRCPVCCYFSSPLLPVLQLLPCPLMANTTEKRHEDVLPSVLSRQIQQCRFSGATSIAGSDACIMAH